jgi:hypothetical protein
VHGTSARPWETEILSLRRFPILARPNRTPPVLSEHERTDYDPWAARWLVRWLSEAEWPSIDQAAELAATLADLPAEPAALDGLLATI